MVNVPEQLADHLRPIDELVVLPGNPRQGDVGAISQSLERFGQLKPIVVNDDGIILAGNHTYLAAKALGWNEVAAVVATDLIDGEQAAFALADNRLSDLASYDDPALLEMLTHVVDSVGDLDGTGYDLDDIAELQNDLDAPFQLPPTAPDTPVELDGKAMITLTMPPDRIPDVVELLEWVNNDDDIQFRIIN
jgi:hypothetical protein